MRIITKIRNKILRRVLFSGSIDNKKHITSLMRHFKADEYGHECNTKNADLGYGWIHYGLIRQKKPKRVLCIGSRHGFIPAVLAQACKDNGFGSVDFVDAGYDWTNSAGWTGEGFWKTKKGENIFSDFGLENHITSFIMTTKQFVELYPNQLYDYIYIDGDHSYKGVLFDFSIFFPMLQKGGIMAFHDISVKGKRPEGLYGVWKLWEKIEKQQHTIKVDYLGSGLGILQK